MNCVQINQVVMYNIEYEYIIHSHFGNLLMAEFGLAERKQIDNSFYVGHKLVGGWGFLFNGCYNTSICVDAYHDSSNSFRSVLSDNKAGVFNGTFNVVVNRKTGVFAIYNHADSTEMYEFREVTSPEVLCLTLSTRDLPSGDGKFSIAVGFRNGKIIF